MFLTTGTSLDKLPPTKNDIYFKVMRSVYQAMVWRNSTVNVHIHLQPNNYGWDIENEKFKFKWSSLPAVIKVCWVTFVKCNCKVLNCVRNCFCNRIGEKCTTLWL